MLIPLAFPSVSHNGMCSVISTLSHYSYHSSCGGEEEEEKEEEDVFSSCELDAIGEEDITWTRTQQCEEMEARVHTTHMC